MKKQLITLLALTMALCAVLCSCQFLSVDFNGQVNVGTVFPTQDTTYSKGATVTIDGTTEYYEDIATAWIAANTATDKAVTVKLYQDWVAVGGKFYNIKTNGFAAFGYPVLEPRMSQTEAGALPFVLDLNCHTIDATDGGDAINFRCLALSKGEHDDDLFYGDVTIQNGTLIGGHASNGANIDIVTQRNTVTLKNLVIKNGTATNRGGGVGLFGKHTVLYVIGCTIENNTAGFESGALCSYYDATVYIQDTVMRGNSAEYYGGAIRIFNKTNLHFSGNVVIKDNTVSGTADNLYVENSCGLLFNDIDSLEASSYIGITYSDGEGALTEKVAKTEHTGILKVFVADKANYKVAFIDETTPVEIPANGCDPARIDNVPTGYGWYKVVPAN